MSPFTIQFFLSLSHSFNVSVLKCNFPPLMLTIEWCHLLWLFKCMFVQSTSHSIYTLLTHTHTRSHNTWIDFHYECNIVRVLYKRFCECVSVSECVCVEMWHGCWKFICYIYLYVCSIHLYAFECFVCVCVCESECVHDFSCGPI